MDLDKTLYQEIQRNLKIKELCVGFVFGCLSAIFFFGATLSKLGDFGVASQNTQPVHSDPQYFYKKEVFNLR